MFPDANAPQTLLDNISARNAMVKVIVGISGTVSSIVGAKVEAHIFPIKSLAVALDTIVDIHVGSEIGTITKCLGHWLELLLKLLAHWIRWSGPQIVLNTIIWFGKRPLHFDLDGVIGAELGFDFIRINFEHKEGRDGDVPSRSVVCHNRLSRLAHILSIGRNTVLVGAEACVVSNDYTCSPRTLSVADFLHKGASTTVHHEDVRRRPWLHVPTFVLRTDGIARSGVNGGVAKIRVGVVDTLSNRTAIGRNSKQGLTVIVSFRAEKGLGDMNLEAARDRVGGVGIGNAGRS
jgi:hypothetical protein